MFICLLARGLTAYDLRLIVDKDAIDVLKPNWIVDSVEQGRKASMTKKLVFWSQAEFSLLK